MFVYLCVYMSVYSVISLFVHRTSSGVMYGFLIYLFVAGSFRVSLFIDLGFP